MTVTAAAPEPPPPRQPAGSRGRPPTTPPPSAPRPVARLVQVRGQACGRAHDLPPGRHTLGRHPDAAVATDDPTVSHLHVDLDVEADGRVFTIARPATNGTRLDHRWLGPEPAHLTHDTLLVLGATGWRAMPVEQPSPRRTRPLPDESRELHRPPRRQRSSAPEPSAPPRPPAEPARVELGVVTIVAPVLLGVVLGLVFSPVLALLSLASPVVLLASWIENRRRARRLERSEGTRFAEELADLGRALDQARADEQAHRRSVHPDLAELSRRAEHHDPRLWERRRDHDDFLRLSIGHADLPWHPPLRDAGAETHPDVQVLVDRPLPDVPVEVPLDPGAVVGIVGARSARHALARSLLCQVLVHHGPADVEVEVVADDDEPWAWLSPSPHRATMPAGAATGDRPRVVLVEGRRSAIGPDDPLRALIGDGVVAALVLQETADALPASCTSVVTLLDPGAADGRTGLVDGRPFRFDGAHPLAAAAIACHLSGLRDPERGPDATTAEEVPLETLLGLPAGHDHEDWSDRIAGRWSQGHRDTVPVGVTHRDPLTLDLSRDGPHGLVAGTTGSGKSELLRSLVLSLAASMPPTDLSFVLVDYKGGSAFDVCAALPHVVGLVTDLDEQLAERALRSLRAELVHRERRLREVGAADLESFRRTRPDAHLPRLVVVVDEFASLAIDVPDFVPALVGLAQRGRSLGIHVLLATQRPAGVVTDDMRANLSLRVALRVIDGADSAEVLGTTDAARLPAERPGAALVRRGSAEPTAFRAARSAHIGALVQAIAVAHDRTGAPSPERPWLPPLPPVVTLDQLDQPDQPGGAGGAGPSTGGTTRGTPPTVPLALLDDPDQRIQSVWRWSMGAGHLLVVGAARSGLSSALCATALGAARRRSPAELHLYVLHAGSASLDALLELPHVGGVVHIGDTERVDRLLQRLERRFEHGAPACAAEPAIVLLVDGLDTVFDTLSAAGRFVTGDRLVRVLRQSPDVGVHVAAATRRVSALPGGFADATDQRLALRLNDPLDYTALGLPARKAGDFPPGRGFDARSGNEIQVALPPLDLDRLVADAFGADGSAGPEPVAVLPHRVPAAAIAVAAGHVGDTWFVPVGLGGAENDPVGLRLAPGDHALIAGPRGSGRTTTLATVAASARLGAADAVVLALASTCPVPAPGITAGVPPDRLALLAPWLRRCRTPWLLLVDDADRVEDDGTLADLVAEPGDHGHVVVAVRTDRVATAYGHWTRAVLASETGLVLGPGPARHSPWDLPVGAETVDEPRVPGRGLLIDRGHPERVQVAT